jgi:hypothetical protein
LAEGKIFFRISLGERGLRKLTERMVDLSSVSNLEDTYHGALPLSLYYSYEP